jgi:hypothetical protein
VFVGRTSFSTLVESIVTWFFNGVPMGLPPGARPPMIMKIDRVPTQSRKRQRPSLVFLRLRSRFFNGVVVPTYESYGN